MVVISTNRKSRSRVMRLSHGIIPPPVISNILLDPVLAPSNNMEIIDNVFEALYVFSNVRDLECYVTNSEGIKSPIAYNNNLDSKELSKGIYVVKINKISKVGNYNSKELIEYYKHGRVSTDLSDIAITLLTSGIDSGNMLRQVTFHPIEDVYNKIRIIDPKNKLLFSYKDATADYPIERTSSLNGCNFRIELYDNDHEGTVFYAKMFGVVVSVTAASSIVKTGITITYNDGDDVRIRFIPFNNVNEIGLHLTSAEARHHGDIKTSLALDTIRSTEREVLESRDHNKLVMNNVLDLQQVRLEIEREKGKNITSKGNVESTSNNVATVKTGFEVVKLVAGLVTKFI